MYIYIYIEREREIIHKLANIVVIVTARGCHGEEPLDAGLSIYIYIYRERDIHILYIYIYIHRLYISFMCIIIIAMICRCIMCIHMSTVYISDVSLSLSLYMYIYIYIHTSIHTYYTLFIHIWFVSIHVARLRDSQRRRLSTVNNTLNPLHNGWHPYRMKEVLHRTMKSLRDEGSSLQIKGTYHMNIYG